MIKANELRIGNLIKQKCTNEYRGVNWFDIMNTKKADEDSRYKVEAEDLLPIPITPEILSKAGFQFDGDWNYKNGNLVLHDMSDTDIKCFEVYWQYPKDVMVVGNFLTIRHLHQLQNLYFALTCEELAINL